MLAYRTALASRLLSVAGGLVGNRVYLRYPKITGTLPQITYFIVADNSSIETLPNQILFQVDIWSQSDVEIEQICDALHTGLHDIPFVVVGAEHAFLREVGRRDLPPETDGEKELHRVMEFRSIIYFS